MDQVRSCFSAARRWIRIHRLAELLPHLRREWPQPIGTTNPQIFAFCNHLQQFVNRLQQFRTVSTRNV